MYGIGTSRDILAEAAALHGALTASDSGLLSTAATFTDHCLPADSIALPLIGGRRFAHIREIRQQHFNVDRMAVILFA